MKQKQLLHLTLMMALPALLLANAQPCKGAVVNTVPYLESFDDESSFGNFVVLDNNHDGSTWSWYVYDECARYYYNSTNAANDWLLTPLIRLEAGSTYKLSFKYRRGYSAGEMLEVAFGTSDNPDNYMIVAEAFEVQSSSYEDFNAELIVSETGDYRVGFHAVSPADLFYICVDDISITAGADQSAPDAPTEFTCTPGNQGALTAHFSLNAPTTSINGETLTALNKIEILCDDEVVHTFDNPSPGEALTCDITVATSGMKTFKAIAYADNAPGRAAELQTYVGIDTPLPPTNVHLIDNGKTITIEWEASPAMGKHGGYVDTDALFYNVYNYGEEQIASELDELSLLDDDMDTETYPYNPIQYYVTAQNEVGESDFAESPYFAVGPKLGLPVSDSFADGYQSGEMGWWLSAYFVYPAWWSTSNNCYDNDNGSMQLWGGEGQNTINTGKLMLDDADNPYLVFAYYANPGSGNKLEVFGSMMQRDDILLYTIDDASLTGSPGWQKVFVSLNDVKDADYTVIRFRGTCADEDNTPYLDAVEIKDLLDQDLSALLQLPATTGVNEATTIGVTVSNEGGETSGDYDVELYCNNEIVGTESCTALQRGESNLIEFTYTPNVMQTGNLTFYAVVVYAADNNLDNNTTSEAVMAVMPNTALPMPEDAKYNSHNGTNTITWSEPTQADIILEDFENVSPWLTNYVGLWSLVDQDQNYTCYLVSVDHPHMTEPQAYIVYNPENVGLDLTENYMIAPHSGSQFLGCYATDVEMGDGKTNDDWLISRRLNGEPQQISLWAKSLFASYPERFELLYSTGTADISEFTLLQTINEVPDQWTEYTFALPEGARHFAIRCTSEDKMLLMLDDITYCPETLIVLGYNIYRDDELIGQTDAETLEYDDNIRNAECTYQISALYAEGESLPVEATMGFTGIAATTFSQPQISTSDGHILVNGAENQHVRVYSINGMVIYDSQSGIQHNVAVERGFYIVQVGNKSLRVAVK